MQEALLPEPNRSCGNPKCSVDLATVEQVTAKRYCSRLCQWRAHRANRQRRAAELTSKFCTGCQTEKSIDQYSQPWVHYCRPCAGDREKGRYAARGGADYSYARSLRRFYGMTMEEYQDRFEAQGGRCAICREKSTQRLHVDHSHQTGAIRDLLCEWCNHAIGKARDDPSRLRAMADYLERHAQSPSAALANRPEP